MILTGREIQIAIENRLITIDPPPDSKAFSSTTVDLTLDPLLSVFVDGQAGIEETIDPTHPDYDHDRVLAKFTQQIAIPAEGLFFARTTWCLRGRVNISILSSRHDSRLGWKEKVLWPASVLECTLPHLRSTPASMVASDLK